MDFCIHWIILGLVPILKKTLTVTKILDVTISTTIQRVISQHFTTELTECDMYSFRINNFELIESADCVLKKLIVLLIPTDNCHNYHHPTYCPCIR